MSKFAKLHFLRFLKNEEGQILPWLVFLTVLFLGMGGLVLDLGHAYVCYRDLQASTDAAALAGAWEMAQAGATSTTVKQYVSNFSSYIATGSGNTSGANANPNLPSPTVTTNLACVTALSSTIPCTSSSTGDNAIQVIQTTTVPTMFIQALAIFGVHGASSISLTAVASASMRGASASQYNVAIVVDTTASMGSTDSDANCNNTRIYCALEGVQQLLVGLSPCSAGSTSTNCKSAFDTVSLFTFPNIQANEASDDTTCPTSSPAIPAYSTPVPGATWSAPTGTSPTYQVTSFLDNYLSTNQSGGSVSTSSALGIATGGSTSKNCSGLQTPGGDGTYYAGAIYAAGSALAAAQKANPSSQNALIILSDGASNTTKMTATNGETLTTTGVYPSLNDQCQQGVTAAQYVAAQPNTTVYTVAYGASTSSGQCTTDPTLTPCAAMLADGIEPSDFYSDATASANKGQCTSADNPNLNLNQIFVSIYDQFTVAKLIPNSVF